MQPSLREDPPAVREPPASAVDASRPGPVTWRVLQRMMAVATVVSLFIWLLGPMSVGPVALAKRAAMYLVYGWSGSLLGMATNRLLHRWSGPRPFWLEGLLCGLLMMPPMTLVVWVAVTVADGATPPRAALPEIFWQVTLICVGMSYLAELFARRRVVVAPAAPPPPKFLERLPLKLRGAEVWAVEAEDHYLRLHTSRGQDLILMRLSDAIAELEGVEGAQVHRSWWIARDAITDAQRGDGRATLRLKDGAEAPVSRTYARILRERGWI